MEDKQITFLKHIQSLIGPSLSLVSELSDLLDVSTDSAYRRIRGETSLSFDEISRICHRYRISFDTFNNSDSSTTVNFHYQPFERTSESFFRYFEKLSQDIQFVKSLEEEQKQVFYAGQGIPIFYYLKFPHLSAFKMFYWMKSIVNLEEYQHARYQSELVTKELTDLGFSIFKDYLDIPSIEIWTDTTTFGTIRQIEFYWNSGVLSDKEVALKICEDTRALFEYVREMCEYSEKWDDYTHTQHKGSSGKLYFSEIEFEHNCILVDLVRMHRVYLGYMNFGSIITENEEYYSDMKNWIDNIIRKSNLISGTSETIRYQFFKRALDRLEVLENKISQK